MYGAIVFQAVITPRLCKAGRLAKKLVRFAKIYKDRFAGIPSSTALAVSQPPRLGKAGSYSAFLTP
jgi:hypothetical protein